MNPSNGTPSIFNNSDTICPGDAFPFLGVPLNVGGWQRPHSGKGYADIQTLGYSIIGSNVREYVQTELTDYLKQNKTYCLSFFVSLMDSASNYATSRIGGYLSLTAVSNFNQDLINFVPQVENPYHNFITSKVNWTEINGVFTASGGEKYLTIGNFYDDFHTDTLFSPGIGALYGSAKDYLSGYFIDDVSLTEYSTAYAGRDTNICAGATVNLGNPISDFGAAYSWSVLKGDSSSLKANDTLSTNVAMPKKTSIYLLQKLQCGIYSYDTLTIHIPVSYVAQAGNDTTICAGDSVWLGKNNTCKWCTYNWLPVHLQSPQIMVDPHTNATYVLSLTDSCSITNSSVSIHINYCESPVISIPNVFTPNGDGINEAWGLIIFSGELSILDYSCNIYDRWGLNVFTSNQAGASWDGHSKSGIRCAEGTYYYVISYTDGKTNEQKQVKGFLELVR